MRMTEKINKYTADFCEEYEELFFLTRRKVHAKVVGSGI